MAALGLDLGGTKIAAALLDDAGAVRWEQRWPTPRDDYDGTLRALAAAVHAAEQAAAAGAVGGGAVKSVGIGTPGTACADGRMKNCNSTWLNGRPLRADLEHLLGRPVALANDANCLALSEATDGAGAGAAVVFGVILGTGCGGGIVVHGRVLGGPNGLAGEWGHNPLPWADPGRDPPWHCHCGQRGCNEGHLSGPAIARDHHHLTGCELGAEAIAAAAAAGDAAAQATLHRHAERLARALAGVINLLDPDVIVLGGGVSRLPGLVGAVQAQWGRWVFSSGAVGSVGAVGASSVGAAAAEPVRTRLALSHHGDASGVRGAAWLGAALGG